VQATNTPNTARPAPVPGVVGQVPQGAGRAVAASCARSIISAKVTLWPLPKPIPHGHMPAIRAAEAPRHRPCPLQTPPEHGTRRTPELRRTSRPCAARTSKSGTGTSPSKARRGCGGCSTRRADRQALPGVRRHLHRHRETPREEDRHHRDRPQAPDRTYHSPTCRPPTRTRRRSGREDGGSPSPGHARPSGMSRPPGRARSPE
jgi:hypothetical protein